jgi:hypothetical protein
MAPAARSRSAPSLNPMAATGRRRPPTPKSPAIHLAIIDRRTAGCLSDGVKRIETRFSNSRRAPFGRVRPGDLVVFKISGGKVLGAAAITRVRQYDHLTPAQVAEIRRRYGPLICAPPAYWRSRRNRRYAVLIWLARLGPPPPLQPPRQYGNGWLVLGPAEHLGFARHKAWQTRPFRYTTGLAGMARRDKAQGAGSICLR